jgi:hypothetical protein
VEVLFIFSVQGVCEGNVNVGHLFLISITVMIKINVPLSLLFALQAQILLLLEIVDLFTHLMDTLVLVHYAFLLTTYSMPERLNLIIFFPQLRIYDGRSTFTSGRLT